MRQKTSLSLIGIATAILVIGTSVPPATAEAGVAEDAALAVQTVTDVAPEVFDNVAEDVVITDTTARTVLNEPSSTSRSGATELVASAVLDSTSASATLEGLVGEPVSLIMEPQPGSEAEITAGGQLVVENASGVTSVAVIKEDASVQIASTIKDNTSTERIAYSFESTVPSSLTVTESGLVLLLDADGGYLGSVAAPWAKDAAGAEVPTRFEVSGNDLVQVVDHQDAGYVYPIVADPYGGKNLFGGMSYNITARKHSITKSAYGAEIHYPTNYWIFTDHGWAEFLDRTPAPNFVNTSVHQQYDCHVAGGYFDWAGPTWDFEIDRPARNGGNWGFGVAIHRCNWNTANQY